MKELPHLDELRILYHDVDGPFHYYNGYICFNSLHLFPSYELRYHNLPNVSSLPELPCVLSDPSFNKDLSESEVMQIIRELLQSNKIALAAKLLLSKTENDKKVFQRLSSDAIKALKNEPQWEKLFKQLKDQIGFEMVRPLYDVFHFKRLIRFCSLFVKQGTYVEGKCNR